MTDSRIEYLIKKIKENAKDFKTFASKIGVNYTTLDSFLKKGKFGNASIGTLLPICKELNIPIEDLYNFKFDNFKTTVELPIVGSVSCGNGTLSFDSVLGYYSTPSDWMTSGEYFFVIAKGDSMLPKIENGSMLLIRSQPTVESGEIAAVLVKDEVLCKKVLKTNNSIVLQSLNSSYEPIIINSQDSRILGLVKKIINEV